jgi:GNAT superfamily N-acetyltransferase
MDPEIIIRDMQPEDEEFVSMCGHSREEAKDNPIFIADCLACRSNRTKWFREKYQNGFRAKVALLNNVKAGFLYCLPIEISPWGPIGENLLVIPCLNINEPFKGKGIGKKLLDAAEIECKEQGKKGVVLIAYNWNSDFFLMPAQFFVNHGYEEVDKISHSSGNYEELMLWKVNDKSAEKPTFLVKNYVYSPIPGKVVVDLFYNTFCETSNTEAERVREVCTEFDDKVILREYSADDREQLKKHQISRAIYVNGKEISWGYEAPRKGIREAITQILSLNPEFQS